MRRLPLHNRAGDVVARAIVDDKDYALVSRYYWSIGTKGYVIAHDEQRRTMRMHRLILGLKHGDPIQGDHVNKNKLDNRRTNLRRATASQQAQNREYTGRRSRFRGVYLNHSRWRAVATIQGERYELGTYGTQEEAHEVVSAFRAQHMTHAPEAASV